MTEPALVRPEPPQSVQPTGALRARYLDLGAGVIQDTHTCLYWLREPLGPAPAPESGGHDVILLDDHRVGAGLLALSGLGLSARQAEVLLQVARGRTNAEVAAALHISPRTVQKHLDNIYDVLGVRSRAAATARAVAATGAAGR